MGDTARQEPRWDSFGSLSFHCLLNSRSIDANRITDSVARASSNTTHLQFGRVFAYILRAMLLFKNIFKCDAVTLSDKLSAIYIYREHFMFCFFSQFHCHELNIEWSSGD